VPIPQTNLDNRRWLDLADEGVNLVPRFAPRWTDLNIHDPGRTLIELFAWLTEANLYRLNQVPDRHRRKFLELLGFIPSLPHPADSVLGFTPSAATASILLPAGVLFETIRDDDETHVFRTMRDVTLSPVLLTALWTDLGGGVIQNHTADWKDGGSFPIFGPDPVPGAALYLGFSNLPTQTPLALFFGLKPPGNDDVERRRVLATVAEDQHDCQRVQPSIDCGIPVKQATDLVELPEHHSVRLAWEVLTAPNTWLPLTSVAMPVRPMIGEVVDDTRSLTLDGLVELNLPPGIVQASLGAVTTNLFYIRCRFVEGGYDASPQLQTITPNGVRARQSLPICQSFVIAAGATVSGTQPAPPSPSTPFQLVHFNMQMNAQGQIQQLDFLGSGPANAPAIAVLSYSAPTTPTSGQILLELVQVGTGTGRPLSPIKLPQPSADSRDFSLYTHQNGTWQTWTRREDFDASMRTDAHFVLDASSESIHFGDGEHGKVPSAGELILIQYAATDGASGNVPPGSITALADPSTTPRNAALLVGWTQGELDQLQTVVNPQAAVGGTDAEALSTVSSRAVETLHAHDRLLDLADQKKSQTLDQIDARLVQQIRSPRNAVNLLDIERLALDVPGTRVARARAWASHHPSYPCLRAAGVVTVVVIPELPRAKPQPTAGLLSAIQHHIEPHRTICTRVEITGPSYIEVTITAQIQARIGADAAGVQSRIINALNQWLDPRVGGPLGYGWPFGRSVYRAEVLQVIGNVSGVDHVLKLSLQSDQSTPQCGDLLLCAWSLVTPGSHQIQVLKSGAA